MRAVGYAIRGGELDRRLFLREFLLGTSDGRQLAFIAITHRNRFTRDEERLPNGHTVPDGHPLPRLQDITKFAFVRVPVGLDSHREHRCNRSLHRIENWRVYRVPAWLRLKI